MQYTANKPYNSVLIIQPSGLRYRLQEDHVFKEIRYTQVTGVKIKKDFFFNGVYYCSTAITFFHLPQLRSRFIMA